MVEWEVNIQPKNHSKNHIMDYALSATVTSVIYDEVVDINISTAFNAEFSLNAIPKNVSMPDKDSYGFAESINARDEMTKFSALLGIINFISSLCRIFSDYPDPILFQIDDLDPSVSDTVSNKPKPVSP